MAEIRVKYKQSLLDIAIQEYGSINEVDVLELENNMSRTDVIPAGTVLRIPDITVLEPDVQLYYKKKQLKPATALSDEDLTLIENTDDCNLCELFK
ncbi:hypothetical protein J1D01_10690 [Seonamhaeicola sp. NFXS20]|uniref:hypothetical protein n=1 Tax=Seonamhaeicola sp. NFXS20 TaxID=2816959 RepID=UPI003B8AB634